MGATKVPTAALQQAVHDHLNLHLYTNAVALAEQLHTAEATNENLHLLANAYIRSGDPSSAYRLLKHHFPFRADDGHRLTYLLGVACGLSNRHSECLGFMRSIPLPTLPSPTSTSVGIADSDRVSVAAVLHWIAISESKQGSTKATAYWASAVAFNPTLIGSFEASMMYGGGDVIARMQPYTTPIATPESSQRKIASPTLSLLAPVKDIHQTSISASSTQLEDARAFLSTKAAIIANLHTYDCATAYTEVSGRGELAHTAPSKDGPSPSYWASLIKAQCCFHISDHTSAARYFADALKAAPWRLNNQVWISYSTSLWHLQDTHTLGTLAQTLLAELGPNPIACAVAGNYYSRLRDQKAAVQMLQRAVELDPSLAPAYTLLGYEELSEGKHAKAIERFCAALRAQPRAFMAIAGMGETELRKGNLSAARDEFYKALSINPIPSVMQRYAATFHRREASGEELRNAIDLYNEILQKQPKYPLARLRKAAALLQLGDPQSALVEVEQLQQADGAAEAEVWLTKGRCHARMGDRQNAIAALNKAIDLDARVANDAKTLLEDLQH